MLKCRYSTMKVVAKGVLGFDMLAYYDDRLLAKGI